MRDVPIRKEWLLLLAALLLTAVAGLCVFLWRATTLTIAVAADDGDEALLMGAYSDTLRQRRLDLRVHILRLDSLRQCAEALQARKADMAVVRPDVQLPVDALTVAVLREDAAVFLAPAGAGLIDVSDLAQRRLGVIVQHEADLTAIGSLLAHYDLSPARVTLVPLLRSEAGAAISSKRVDAVVLFAAPSSAMVSALVKSLRGSSERRSQGISVLAISDAAAIAQDMPKFSEVEIPAGGLGGARKQPPDDLKTVGITYRLMARPDLDRPTVALIAQTLFQMRSRLARVTPLANRMEAIDPDNATGAALPYHPGAIDYFAREQKTFMERYADWIYISMFGGGGIGSALAWIRQRMLKRRREMMDKLLDRLLILLQEIRTATTAQALDTIVAEVDMLVTSTIRQTRKRMSGGGARTLNVLSMAIDSVRAAIIDRRIALTTLANLVQDT